MPGLSPLSCLELLRKHCPLNLTYCSCLAAIPLGLSSPCLGVAGLPSNLFTHIPFKPDSAPSEQLLSLAVEVFKFVDTGHVAGDIRKRELFPCVCQLASS